MAKGKGSTKNWQRQLQEFYRRQGTTGKALRKALQYDRKAFIRNHVRQYGRPVVWVESPHVSIGSLFTWADSPEGLNYWAARDVIL